MRGWATAYYGRRPIPEGETTSAAKLADNAHGRNKFRPFFL